MGLVVIAGPTSSGKTTKSLQLCKEYNGEIISADSRQVVRGLDIGTGKIPLGKNNCFKAYEDHYELEDVTIWGYDLVNPDQAYSAFDFSNYFAQKRREIEDRGKNVFLVGGTGFYLDSALGMVPLDRPKADPEVRKKLEKLPTETLALMLEEKSPELSRKIDLKNPRRMIRALEILFASEEGKVEKHQQKASDFPYIVLHTSRNTLYARVDSWCEEIWGEPLFEEYRTVEKKYPQSTYLTGLVYKSVGAYLLGQYDYSEALSKMKFSLHAYIRRQQTWFKRNTSAMFLSIEDEAFDSELRKIVESGLDG